MRDAGTALPKRTGLRRFLLPPLSRRFLLRLVVVGTSAWILFGYILIPLRIQGTSMEPTYRDGGLTFCWKLRYAFSEPARGDVVAVRLAGTHVVYLKRVVGLEGETVAFRDGELRIDGEPLDEPYVRLTGNWDLPPRTVKAGNVYVVGDNRGGPMEGHVFGQTGRGRIAGGPLW